MTNNETKKITISSEGVVSVGGAYYKSYTVEDKDYKVGEIIKATITETAGSQKRESYEVDLEVNEDFIKAIECEREYLKKEEYFQSLKSKRETLNLYRLTDDIDCNLAAHVNAQRDGADAIYSSICESLENGDYDIWDEEGDLDVDKEREYIYKMTNEEIKDFLIGYDYASDSFYENLWDEINEYEENEEDLEDEDYLYKKKLLDDRPSVYLLLTDEEIKKQAESVSESGYIKIDGYEYLFISSF